jgi:pentatricopeptide repeat protein
VALDIFEAVRHDVHAPGGEYARSPFVFNSALHALRQQRNVDEALALLLQMAAGQGAAPDANSFQTMLVRPAGTRPVCS